MVCVFGVVACSAGSFGLFVLLVCFFGLLVWSACLVPFVSSWFGLFVWLVGLLDCLVVFWFVCFLCWFGRFARLVGLPCLFAWLVCLFDGSASLVCLFGLFLSAASMLGWLVCLACVFGLLVWLVVCLFAFSACFV